MAARQSARHAYTRLDSWLVGSVVGADGQYRVNPCTEKFGGISEKLHRSIAGKPNRPRLCPYRTGVVPGVPHSMHAPTPCSSPQFPNLDSHVQPDDSTILPTTGRNRLRTRTLCAGFRSHTVARELLTQGLQPYPSVANRTDSCFVSTTRAAPTTDSCSTSVWVTNARRDAGRGFPRSPEKNPVTLSLAESAMLVSSSHRGAVWCPTPRGWSDAPGTTEKECTRSCKPIMSRSPVNNAMGP